MLLAEGSAQRILVGAADERTLSQHRIMERMGLWREREDGEGATFLLLSDRPSVASQACISVIDFPEMPLDEKQIVARYGVDRVLYDGAASCDCYPTASARMLVRGIGLLGDAAHRVAVYNRYLADRPSVIVLSACS